MGVWLSLGFGLEGVLLFPLVFEMFGLDMEGECRLKDIIEMAVVFFICPNRAGSYVQYEGPVSLS